jgi:hypothetical protein
LRRWIGLKLMDDLMQIYEVGHSHLPMPNRQVTPNIRTQTTPRRPPTTSRLGQNRSSRDLPKASGIGGKPDEIERKSDMPKETQRLDFDLIAHRLFGGLVWQIIVDLEPRWLVLGPAMHVIRWKIMGPVEAPRGQRNPISL